MLNGLFGNDGKVNIGNIEELADAIGEAVEENLGSVKKIKRFIMNNDQLNGYIINDIYLNWNYEMMEFEFLHLLLRQQHESSKLSNHRYQ